MQVLSMNCYELLHNFEFERVINEDTRLKRITLVGTVNSQDNKPKRALIDIEWSSFSMDIDFLSCLIDFLKNTMNSSQVHDIFQNDMWYGCHIMNIQPKTFPSIKCDIVCPASDADIIKRSVQDIFMIKETPEMYQRIVHSFILSQPEDRTLWIQHIIDGTSEKESIYCHRRFVEQNKQLYMVESDNINHNTGYIILPDSKWDRKTLSGLYLLGIIYDNQSTLYSIRDLHQPTHLFMLQSLLEDINHVILQQFGLNPNMIRIYFHYHPTFYKLHVHITHNLLELPGMITGRAHLLEDVIDNMKTFGIDYYKKKTIVYTVGQQSDLWNQCLNKQ